MSADNWAVCPVCLGEALDAKAADNKVAKDAYGEAPIEEFLLLKARAELPVAMESLRTFREDYEIGMCDDGMFSVTYRGGCNTCGAKFQYAYDVRPELKRAEKRAGLQAKRRR
jgi:hypothetical protein